MSELCRSSLASHSSLRDISPRPLLPVARRCVILARRMAGVRPVDNSRMILSQLISLFKR